MTDEHVASLIIIGDDILRGQVQDANTIYLAKCLETKGFPIRKVVVIPDEVDIIAKEVSEASEKYSIVFTSGGIGPTHDNLTFEGVAKGLGLSLKENEKLVTKLSKLFPDKPASRQLATVPYPCKLINVPSNNSDGDYDVVKVRNVFVLPGSPSYFRRAVDAVVASPEVGPANYTDSLEIELEQSELLLTIVNELNRWYGIVKFRSYPQEGGPRPWTRLELVASNQNALVAAKDAIVSALPRKARPSMQPHIRSAYGVLEECYARYKNNEVFLSFNGGKDCTTVLHLVTTFACQRGFDPPLCLYVTGDSFPEVDAFVSEASKYFGLNVVRKCGPIKEALAIMLKENPHLKACLMGTRKADPGAHFLKSFAPTDPGWPQIMRVSPIIDWNYNQIWAYLINNKIPYCSLYDEGYTSLGAKSTTTKNPMLIDPRDSTKYLPAHGLAELSTERHGRE